MTSTPALKPPANVNVLNKRLTERAGSTGASQLFKRSVANVVVGQLLPSGAVKGGAALKFRLGNGTTRFTADLDMARRDALAAFLADFGDNLQRGWHAFTGRLVTKAAAKPTGVPAAYVMQPFEVKLAYQGRSWLTVPVEIGPDEIGDTDAPDVALAPDLIEDFAALGLPRPQPIAVLALDHQIAQKLHAASGPGSERAHDLVDRQLLVRAGPLDLRIVARTCRRLFTSRRAHTWPPTVAPTPGWAGLYLAAAADLDVLPDVTAAAAWVNELISNIDAAA